MESGFNDLQGADAAEFAGVERGNGPTALQGGRGDDQVVGADHLAGGGELRPDSCVRAGHTGIHRYDFQAPKELLDPASASPGAAGFRLDFDAKPQFAESDGTDGHRLGRPRVEPGRQVEASDLSKT